MCARSTAGACVVAPGWTLGAVDLAGFAATARAGVCVVALFKGDGGRRFGSLGRGQHKSARCAPSWQMGLFFSTILQHSCCPSVKFFSKLNYFIFGYFEPTNYFLIIKINIFWGDLSGISAKTATLLFVPVC